MSLQEVPENCRKPPGKDKTKYYYVLIFAMFLWFLGKTVFTSRILGTNNALLNLVEIIWRLGQKAYA